MLKINEGAHIQSQARVFKFDLSLMKILYSSNTRARAHVQSQTQFVEFDVHLTKTQYSDKR